MDGRLVNVVFISGCLSERADFQVFQLQRVSGDMVERDENEADEERKGVGYSVLFYLHEEYGERIKTMQRFYSLDPFLSAATELYLPYYLVYCSQTVC